MKLPRSRTAVLLSLLASRTTAQVLTNGNSQLPACASSCALLNQAAQACGGTTTASQSIWSCFCQSGYLTTLYTSPIGICDSTCTSPSDNQQVMSWYTSNCGSDHGASEHADSGSGNSGGTTVLVVTSTSTSAPGSAATGSVAALPSTTASGGTVSPDAHTSSGGAWWSTHYKWVIMLIVLFVALLLLALLAIWLKRRHDRKADQIREGFNTGITTRSAPTIATAGPDVAGPSVSQIMSGGSGMDGGEEGKGSGRNTPARMGETGLPYGYGFTRSESRLGSHADNLGGRSSPLARGGTPVGELEKDVGMSTDPEKMDGAPRPKKTRRVLVRERSMEGPGSPEVEKGMGMR